LSTFLQNIYFYCSYSTKTFLKGHERALEAMRMLLEAVIVILEAVRMFVKSVRAHLKAIRELVEAVRILVWPVRVPVEALRLLQRHESVCRGPCDVNKIETKALTFRYRS
jgi:hypothetical protein